MTCPRCGYPQDQEPCSLCGQKEFDRYEMMRFKDGKTKRFEITLIVGTDSLDKSTLTSFSEHVRFADYLSAKSETYFFFQDGTHREAITFLSRLDKSSGDFRILINGRPRPYSAELWLPMISILMGDQS